MCSGVLVCSGISMNPSKTIFFSDAFGPPVKKNTTQNRISEKVSKVWWSKPGRFKPVKTSIVNTNPGQLGLRSSRPESARPVRLGRVNSAYLTWPKKRYVDSLYYCMEIDR